MGRDCSSVSIVGRLWDRGGRMGTVDADGTATAPEDEEVAGAVEGRVSSGGGATGRFIAERMGRGGPVGDGPGLCECNAEKGTIFRARSEK